MSLGAVTATDAAWLCGLLQTGDSFFPTGSYAHSFGLEGLVQAEVVNNRDTLRAFLRDAVVPSLQHVELPLACHGWRVLGDPQDWELVGRIAILAHAQRSPREARVAMENIGRQRAELCAQLSDHALAKAYLERAARHRWPHVPVLSTALEARVLGAPLPALLAAIIYQTFSGLIAAAMKLIRLGHQAAQSLLAELLQSAPMLAETAPEVPVTDIGWFNPWLDIAAARHETSDFRLFIS